MSGVVERALVRKIEELRWTCFTLHPSRDSEVFVAAPYTRGDPFTVMLVMYDWTPNGPVRLSAASPEDAAVRMIELVDASSRRAVITERLARLMTAEGDVAWEPTPGGGGIVVGNHIGEWWVRMDNHPLDATKRGSLSVFGTAQEAAEAVAVLRSR